MSQSPQAIGMSLVVIDLDKTTRFYCEGLGFRAAGSGERGDEKAHTLELASCSFRIRYLSSPEMRLELVEFRSPQPIGAGERRPSNALGPHSISFTCENPEALAAKLVELGGTRVLSDRAGGGRFDMVLVADPDGMRIMLVAATMEDVAPMFAG